MTRAELIDKIDNGSDIMFSVAGKQYTILTWTDDGIAIGEQYPNDSEIKYFDTPEELVDNFKIAGKPLGEMSKEIVITQYA